MVGEIISKKIRDGVRGEVSIGLRAEITVGITEGAKGEVRCERMSRV